MEIYSEDMELIEHPDLALGYLKPGVRVERHEAVEGVQEPWRCEIVTAYENGGGDVRRGIDAPGVEAGAAWEEIQIGHPHTQAELDERETQKSRSTVEARLTLVEAALIRLQEDVRAALEKIAQKEA